MGPIPHPHSTMVTVQALRPEDTSLLTRAQRLRDCARLFARNETDPDFDADYLRLFGDGGPRPTRPLPLVPVCACSYLSGGPDDSLDDVVALYRLLGFDAERYPVRCPGHIATELEFVAHCLVRAANGDSTAGKLARDFTVLHLFTWAAVFAAATANLAQHPAIRYAAESLEVLLHGELTHAGAVE